MTGAVRAVLTGSVAFLALTWTSPSLAQQVPASAPPVPENKENIGTTEAEAAVPTGGIEDIVVTARKRSENLQETPISISAFSAAGIEQRGLTNVSDIDSFTPNLTFQRSAAQSGDKSTAQIYIRGVGQSDFTLTTDPGVGLYLDGVYIARSIGSALDVLDIDRVEVLRGPQGTLFGRNTIGGAISITSRAPDTEKLAGSAEVTVGRFGRLDVKGGINVPVSDSVAFTASVLRKTSDGYITRPNLTSKTGEDNLWAGRIALGWKPSAAFTLNLSADATRIRATSCCSELVAVYPGLLAGFHNAVVAPTLVPTLGQAAFFNNGSLPTRPFQDNAGFNRAANLNLWGVSMNATYEFSNELSIKSITAYRKFDSINGGDIDHTPLRINETVNTFNNRQFSQELQLLGKAFDNRLSYILGAYYFDERGFNEDAVNFSIVSLVSGGFTHNTSVALFGQSSLDVTDTLSITAGMRWTRDTKRFNPRQFVVANPAGVPSQVRSTPGNLVPLQPGDIVVPAGERSAGAADATPYLNLSWKASQRLLLYVSYSEGFKSGGFVQRNFPDRLDVPQFAPEKVQVYEAGIKFETDDRRLRANFAAFNTDYGNLQVQVFDGIAPVTKNAAAARIRGFEGELTLAPTQKLLIEAGIGYLDSKYTAISPAATDITLTTRLVNAPKLSLNVGISYKVDVGGGWSLRPRVDWAYRSTVYNDARNTAALIQPSYSIFNAGLTLTDADDRWSVSASGHNLTNKRYIQSGFADEAVQSVAVATFGRPVEWDISIRRKF